MADGQYTESIVLTAQDDGASAVMQAALAILRQIPGALKEIGVTGAQAGDAVAAGATKAAAGVKKEGVAAAGTSKLLKDLNEIGGSSARMFNALGVSAAGAAGRVEAFTGALGSMGALAPEILAIGAAIVAVGAGFTFFKDGIGDAEALQQSMQRLHAVVDEQGQSWATASEQIKKFIDTESMATGTPETQLAAAFSELAGRIHDVHDAEVIMRVGEEESIATGKSLSEVTTALLEAESGRGQTLAMLDPRLKTLIHDHADLHTILQVLHEDNQKALSDSDSAAMSWARGKVALQAMGESIGDALLPMIQYLGEALIGAIQVAGDFGHAIGTGISGAAMIFVDSAMAIVHSAEMIGDALRHDFKDAAMQGGLAIGSLKSGMKDLENATVGWMPSFGKGFADMFHMHQIGHSTVNEAIYQHDREMSNFSLDNNPPVGYTRQTKGKAKGKGHGAHALAYDFHEIADAIKPATDALKDFDAHLGRLPHTVAGYTESVAELSHAIRDEQVQHVQLEAELKKAHDAYEAARAKANAYGNELKGHTNVTAAEKQHLHDLELAVSHAKTAYDHLSSAVSKNSSEMQHHQTLLDKDKASLKNLTDGFNAFVQQSGKSMEQDLALSQMTDAQKVAYYQQMVDSIAVIDKASQKEKEGYYYKELSAYSHMLAQEEQQRKAETKKEEQYVSTFLDDIIVKHKSFKDEFKHIWDQIVQIFIQDIAKMIVESQLFKNIFGNLMPGSGGGGGGGGFNLLSLLGIGGGGGGGGGAFAAFANAGIPTGIGFGTLADSANLIGIPGSTASAALHVNIAGASPSLMSMFVNSGGGLTMGGALMVGAGAFGVGSAIGNLESGGGPGNTHGIWGGLGSIAGVAGAGMLFGGMGGIAGLIAAGPAGWAVLAGGALLGGIAGGMFGHKDNPAQMPDKYDTGTWGQDNANLWGAGVGSNSGKLMNANGQQFSMDPTLAQQTGNMGLLQYLGKYIQDNPDQAKKLLGSLTGVFTGEDVSVPIPNGKNGILDLANGQQLDWKTLYGDAMQAMQDIQGSGAAGAVPSFMLNRLYPDYNLATVTDGNGNTIIGGGGTGTPLPILHHDPTPGGGGGTNPGDGGSGNGRVGHPHHPIHIDLRGAMLVGPGGLEDVAQTIATALQRLSDGQIAGSYTTTSIAQRRGGDWGPN